MKNMVLTVGIKNLIRDYCKVLKCVPNFLLLHILRKLKKCVLGKKNYQVWQFFKACPSVAVSQK